MDQPSVRIATAEDASVWRSLRHAALQEAPYAFGSTYEHEQDWDDSVYAQRLAVGLSVLGLLGEKPVGIGGGYVEDGCFHIVSIWVRPQSRRRGVNTAMMTRLLELAQAHDLPVELQVALANPGARAAYERLGFVATGELSHVRDGSDEIEERMVLDRPTP